MSAIDLGMANPWRTLDAALRGAGRRQTHQPTVRAVACITVHVDGPAVEVGRAQTPFGLYSAGRYAIRRGVQRHLEILARHGVSATFFACGYDVEQNPALFRDMRDAGHEIAAHGYLHEAWDLGDAEPALLEKTHRIIQDHLQLSPVGWCSPSGCKSARTLPTLQGLGYCYDASEKDMDRPYLAPGLDGFMVLPNNTVSLDDFPLYQAGQSLASEVYDNWVQELQALREAEGYIHLTVHPKAGGGSGTPARAAVLDRFLGDLRGCNDLHICTLQELALHCLGEPEAWSVA